ncbi:MAG: hypothetical protein VW405_04785 [Rhodospirillaceae bacterium]
MNVSATVAREPCFRGESSDEQRFQISGQGVQEGLQGCEEDPALGLTGTWGSAVSGFVSQMGAGSVLSNVLTGAITQAGYGAAVGALSSAVTGGDILKGAQSGALTGAITGGVTGGLGLETDPLKGLGQSGELASEGAMIAADEAASTSGLASDLNSAGALNEAGISAGEVADFNAATSGTLSRPPTGFGVDVSGGAGGVTPANTASGFKVDLNTTGGASGGGAGGDAAGVFDKGGWLERNGNLAGGLLQGAGKGVFGYLGSKAEAENQRQLLQDKQDIINANYQTNGEALLKPSDLNYVNQQPARQTPAQQFAYRRTRYVYDPAQGRVVLTQVA